MEYFEGQLTTEGLKVADFKKIKKQQKVETPS